MHTSPIAQPLRRLAGDPGAFCPVEPGDERIEDPRFVITLDPGDHPWSAQVLRLRFADDEVDATVEEIRRALSGRGRALSMWSVGSSSTPPDLAARLVSLGLVPEEGPGVAAMVLVRPPTPPPTASFDVRLAETLDDYRTAVGVFVDSFGFSPKDAGEARSSAERDFRRRRAGGHTALALVWDGDVPVATGRVTFTPWGLFLGGGGTLRTPAGEEPSAR